MQSSLTQIQALVLWRIITDKKLLPSGKTILILCSRIAPIARIFFVTCFGTTEMTELTDFVSIACSLRYWPVTYPWRNTLAQFM